MVYRGRNKSVLGGLSQTRKVFPMKKMKKVDNSIIADKKTQQKLKEMSKLGQAITHQVEIALPSAKAPVEMAAPPKLSSLENKLFNKLEQGKSLTDKEIGLVGKVQDRVNKAPTIGKKLVKKALVKAKSKLSPKQQKLIDRVKQQISKQEGKLAKLHKLLKDCEDC